MMWGLIGRLLLRELPRIIESVQDVGQAHGSDAKRAAVVTSVLAGMKDIGVSDAVLNNPKVQAALIAANDAIVDAHDTIAVVQAEAASVKPVT